MTDKINAFQLLKAFLRTNKAGIKEYAALKALSEGVREFSWPVPGDRIKPMRLSESSRIVRNAAPQGETVLLTLTNFSGAGKTMRSVNLREEFELFSANVLRWKPGLERLQNSDELIGMLWSEWE